MSDFGLPKLRRWRGHNDLTIFLAGALAWVWIVLVFCSLNLFAVDDVGVSVTTVTNTQAGLVTTKKSFTRRGQTNLVHLTHRVNGVVGEHLYRFYHDGQHAADYLIKPDSGKSFVDTYNGFELHVACESNVLTEATICEKQHRVLDRFAITNGMLTPVAASELIQRYASPGETRFELPKEVGK